MTFTCLFVLFFVILTILILSFFFSRPDLDPGPQRRGSLEDPEGRPL